MAFTEARQDNENFRKRAEEEEKRLKQEAEVSSRNSDKSFRIKLSRLSDEEANNRTQVQRRLSELDGEESRLEAERRAENRDRSGVRRLNRNSADR